LISGIFVAGSGTDVGKTVVTAGVLRFLRRHGEAAMAMKPVQTGCDVATDGRMFAPDIEFVLRAAGLEVDEETRGHLAPYRFAPACSPHLAARLAGERIELETILTSAHWLSERYRHLVVEGAGGVLVPLNETQTMLSIACELRMPVLLVGHSGLGTINHVLLSLEAIRRRGCEVLGVVLNDTQPVSAQDSYIHEDNVASIRSLGKVPVTRIPHLRSAPEAPLEMERLDAVFEQCEFLNLYESIGHE
jgi:dethiobiotin synthase